MKCHLGPKSSSLPILLDFSLTGSVAFHAFHLEVRFTIVFDKRSGDESHERYGQELSQRPPGEDVIQRGDLWEDGPRANTDEVVGDQTWRRERRPSDQYLCQFCLRVLCVMCVVSPMSTEKKKMGIGMLRTGQVMLRNQLGVIGKKRRKRRKKNKLLRFSSTWQSGEDVWGRGRKITGQKIREMKKESRFLYI